ncbi:MAG: D-tyrosyl-tRNA(Tyr) deacylase [Deltaproteobacteria bacterium]|nr:D-tyrosyl-tRNA(Tyr) deacylase [Deltaproteobacteria bacterium]
MRAVIQRVSQGRVLVNKEEIGTIGRGLVILLGVGRDDTGEDGKYLAAKIVNLRIFGDENDKMNRSLLDVGGQALIVSQFTLWGDTRKGRRPSFIAAAEPDTAEALYEDFVSRVQDLGVTTATGKFGAMMELALVNDGPVTLILDSRKEF